MKLRKYNIAKGGFLGAECCNCGFPFEDVPDDDGFDIAYSHDDGFHLFCGRRCFAEWSERHEAEIAGVHEYVPDDRDQT
jgi:hypothetical protein